MPVHPVSITEAKASLSALVNRVAYSHERIVLQSHGRPKAALIGLDDLEILETGGASSHLKDLRLEGLGRIRSLASTIRRSPRQRRRPVAVDLAELRSTRDARLGRVR